MMEDKAALILIALVSAPALVIGLAAVIRGYHVTLHIWRHNRKDDEK